MHDIQTPLVAMRGCSKNYGSVVALQSIDFALQPGTLTAILGRNGAGKSTLVGLLLGLLQPTAGEIRVLDRAPFDLAVRQQRGVMLQSAGLPRQLTVRELVALYRGYYPVPRSIEETLDLAGVTDLASRRCNDLSGGQKRCVQFALAICGRPRLLVLDEPTVAIDLEMRRNIWRTIRAVVQSGTAVVLTTHHMEEAEALADRIVVLDRGRIVADGSQAQVKARFSLRTIRCRTALAHSELAALSGVRQVAQSGQYAILQTQAAEQTMRELLARDATIADLALLDTDLEDAFFALTQSTDIDSLQKVA